MPLNDLAVVLADEPNGIPPDAELRRVFDQVAANVKALVNAPGRRELFRPGSVRRRIRRAAHGPIGRRQLRVPRRPVADPGRPAPFLPSDFETRLGSRILPEWIDVVDDATQQDWRGRKLLGHYPFDVEGVPPKPVALSRRGRSSRS
jgi:hypothetical protein